MSRLTGKEAFGLMEAYRAVYAPRELTEEQVWEGVENWVQSLLEDGYDLSDYTWEEMYENYITESPALLAPAIGSAAPYVLPALGAAAALIKNNLNKTNKMVTTPDEERFLNTGQLATKKLSPEELAERKAAREAKRKALKDQQLKDQQLKDKAVESEKTTTVGSPTSSDGGGSATGGSDGGPKTPKGPNWFQRNVSPKVDEFNRAVGRGGKGPGGRGITSAAGELVGSILRTPTRQTLDVVRRFGPPLIAPALGAGLLVKGVADVADPKTGIGKFVRGVRDHYEIGDILIDYLIEEKYAQDEKSALSIVKNMSEKWAVTILENYFES